MSRTFPASILELLRVRHWALLVLCLVVPLSLTRTARKWQEFLHAAAPATLEHHQDHHAAGHFENKDHNHAPDAQHEQHEHHREHHAQHDDHSENQTLLSSFRWSPPLAQSLFLPPHAVLVRAIVPPAPRALYPFGRDGPEAGMPPAEHLSLPLAGRAPPVV